MPSIIHATPKVSNAPVEIPYLTNDPRKIGRRQRRPLPQFKLNHGAKAKESSKHETTAALFATFCYVPFIHI
ncbi:hypothetical protein LGM90_10115 [Burkholderia sp. AU28942]|uniref:hypothetical protein n=1 Tax=Burkholderia TaxID=32008 RepID=UPI00142D2006|nr:MULTISPECIES: hypothetical protein [Burkholderia]MCA8308862.1 hypothetical protein [Burkholderia sp. AU28942]QTO50864.1 hypothetical protein J8I86_25470 [Burkholderia latens]